MLHLLCVVSQQNEKSPPNKAWKLDRAHEWVYLKPWESNFNFPSAIFFRKSATSVPRYAFHLEVPQLEHHGAARTEGFQRGLHVPRPAPPQLAGVLDLRRCDVLFRGQHGFTVGGGKNVRLVLSNMTCWEPSTLDVNRYTELEPGPALCRLPMYNRGKHRRHYCAQTDGTAAILSRGAPTRMTDQVNRERKPLPLEKYRI